MTKIVRFFGIMIPILLSILACSNDQVHHTSMPTANSRHSDQQSVYRPDLFLENIAFPFGEGLGQPLESGTPPSEAKLIKSFALSRSEAEVHIYKSGGDASPIYTGYLKGKNSEWKLGNLTNFNENQAWINPMNFLTGDVSGASIEIPFGKIGAKNGLVIYHHKTDSWKIIDFQGHTAIPMDLDNDGVPEWVGNQTDWVPPAVEIHRWVAEYDRFESTVIQWDSSLFPDEAKEEVFYSSLFVEEGKHFIEIGNKDGYAFFTFDHGFLKQYKPADTRSRFLEMQMARQHH
ncbi:hypothetical protein QFZ77_002967 [Paenibacillus sp. V4I3]|uniref:hypothetical protein n=1 Tax=Paenibacillus sp. V4I3 TaxID=3042305 RepID=UPI0027890178|nr:hypothetical protein [Paenibacillus sp. V4I3]MDQ0874308.1 hypothetical protein [Paenibacillus sp. V4I3]